MLLYFAAALLLAATPGPGIFYVAARTLAGGRVEGIAVEALNPKTAAFFLAFIPQFVNPEGSVALQFVFLGLVSVTLNTLADIIVAFLAGRIRDGASTRPLLVQRLREASGGTMIALGGVLAFTRRPIA